METLHLFCLLTQSTLGTHQYSHSFDMSLVNIVMCKDVISNVGRAAVGRWESKRLRLL